MNRHLVIVILFCLQTLISTGQNFSGKMTHEDTLHVLLSSDWRTVDGWFGADKVVLKPLEKLPDFDSTGLSQEEQARRMEIWRENMYFERINFDSAGKLEYTYRLHCPVGETLYYVKTFDLDNGLIFVEYKKWQWSEIVDHYQTAFYKIDKWTKDEILLSKNQLFKE